jgi:hypothetical protein
MQRTGPEGERDFELIQGLMSGALLSLPLWVCIGVVITAITQDGPVSGLQVAILFLAAAAELALLRQGWRFLHPSRPGAPAPLQSSAATLAVRSAQLKPLLLLLAATGAYLHLHFWDIQLQIAAMPSVTVFVNAPALG